MRVVKTPLATLRSVAMHLKIALWRESIYWNFERKTRWHKARIIEIIVLASSYDS